MAARADPLASLARLRRLETGIARRRLAEEADRLLAAEHRADAAAMALRAEQHAGAPADYAAWIGRGMAERDRSAIGAAHAAERLVQGQAALTEARLVQGQAALTEARVAGRCIEQLVRDREAAARARLSRKAQATTDDAAGRAAHAARRV